MGEVDLWPTLWAPLIVVLVMAVLGLLGEGLRRLLRRLDSQDDALAAMQVELAKQFGGNSGGLREAIDQQAKRFDAHLTFHAEHPR